MVIFGDSLSDTNNLAEITNGKSKKYWEQNLSTRRLIDI